MKQNEAEHWLIKVPIDGPGDMFSSFQLNIKKNPKLILLCWSKNKIFLVNGEIQFLLHKDAQPQKVTH